ncbi:hypothetical protein NPIL_551271 [Nephila pilipes]|uniref:Uncharacterized protein n=1 Tax=Nephila pilipes TaxID=299642 RepID=A0A8X6I3F5_NEPPI|nr:hypothetical protein NPIL_551271 [Nephila pilipes]
MTDPGIQFKDFSVENLGSSMSIDGLLIGYGMQPQMLAMNNQREKYVIIRAPYFGDEENSKTILPIVAPMSPSLGNSRIHLTCHVKESRASCVTFGRNKIALGGTFDFNNRKKRLPPSLLMGDE